MTREEGLGRALEVRLTVAGRFVDAVGSAIVGAEDLLVLAGGGVARRETLDRLLGWHGFRAGREVARACDRELSTKGSHRHPWWT
jgi:hypothetical protein